MGKSTPKAPAAPDPTATANAQGAMNKDTAYWNAVMGNVNQNTPYGSISYAQSPVSYDTKGYQDALTAYNAHHTATDKLPTQSDYKNAPTFTSTINLSPEQQKILDQQQQADIQVGKIGNDQIGRIGQAVSSPYSYAGLPSAPSYDDVNKLSAHGEEAIMSRLNPQFGRDEETLRSRLVNQGITQGSEAYNNEMNTFNQGKNDARMQAVLGGQSYGGNEANQQLALRNQAIQEYNAQRNAPLNEFTALTSGQQVQNPQFQGSQPGNAQAGDYQGAAQNAYQAKLGAHNAKVAGNNATTGSLFGLGGSFLGSPLAASMFSDVRIKKNVEMVGEDNGHKFYEFEYKDGLGLPEGRFRGVMAQDVEKYRPEAIIEVDGIKAVNYDMLGLRMERVA